MEYLWTAAVLIVIFRVHVTEADELCNDTMDIYTDNYSDMYYNWNVWNYRSAWWFNMTFWGGHIQIPWKDKLDPQCLTTWGNSVVLTDKHPDISTIGEDIITLQACSLNQNGICEWNMEVKTRTCHGDLLYNFPWFDITNEDTWNQYICFDRMYTETCEDATMVYSAGNENGRYLNFLYGDIQAGWFMHFTGKQFVLPTLDDINDDITQCFDKNWGYGYVLQESLPEKIEDTPIRLSVCDVNMYMYDDNSYYVYTDDNGNCHYYIYVRSCNGRLQFDLSFFRYWIGDMCLIHNNNIKVKPEFGHEIQSISDGGKTVKTYEPFLQYRCSFDMVDDTLFKANWYINGTLQVQLGPSVLSDDLVFKEEYLNHLEPGYEVQCGIIAASGNESVELLSDSYYAGWKISDSSISLSKSGYALVEVEQTIPLGCHYRDDSAPSCVEELSLEDTAYVPDVCKGGIRVQDADQAQHSYINVKLLKKGEEWTNQKYRAKLTTIDNDYDDKTDFDLKMSVTRSSGHASRRSVNQEVVGDIHVDITETNRHWNKRCYSHVDPHMKTVDGLHYEAQREGDYMLALNELSQTEIQTSARYCNHGYTGGPVCACGIAIAVGSDAFVINKCPDSNFTFAFTQCGDGGIIDVERVHDYRYMVRTPIGTIIDIFLHTWSDTMNIDIYMSAKDFGNVVGLCGNFDGDSSNDLLHRDKETVSTDNNWSYQFADSWRLTDEENLFKNGKRYLRPWDKGNGGANQPCSRSNSITRKKCKLNRRGKRDVSRKSDQRKGQNHNLLSRKKRSTGNFTEEEAFHICNNSVYNTPAVKDFPDKLGEEDPDKVVEQCVYDLTKTNDTSWVDAHTTVLNNAADTILMLNPVYVANNTDTVNSFRSNTCLNNCSGNGVCAESGLCHCDGTFDGPDCNIDKRLPPIVYDIEGGDICEITTGDDCTCFQIRTNNVFDGFMCDFTRNKLYFNGTRVVDYNSRYAGDYVDIFTGECCAPPDVRKKRSEEDNTDDLFVIMYDFTVSNDGDTFGETNTVYVYDTTCLQQNEINGTVTFELKTGYCFIDAACVVHNSQVLTTDVCFLCDPATDPYSWTEGSCGSESSTWLTTGALIGIVIGSLAVAIVTCVLIYCLCFKGSKKHRVVQDVQSLAGTNPSKHVYKKSERSIIDVRCASESDVTILQDIRVFCPSNQSYSRNMHTGTLSAHYVDMINRIPAVERNCTSIEKSIFMNNKFTASTRSYTFGPSFERNHTTELENKQPETEPGNREPNTDLENIQPDTDQEV